MALNLLFLLLALIYGDRVDFATSMRPENPEWQETHDEWGRLAQELDLPVTLGLADGDRYPFLDLLGWSDFIVTTSIAEGFGLAQKPPLTGGFFCFCALPLLYKPAALAILLTRISY